jgi:hypothetical protein
MTISKSSAVPYKYSEFPRATVVPSKYSVDTLLHFFENVL